MIIKPCLPSSPIDFWSDRERMSFRLFPICAAVVNVDYCPLAHMVWAKVDFGLYGGIGALDFAGTVVQAPAFLPS